MLNLEETEQGQIETQKLLAKRQRRCKIQEINIDYDEVLKASKRFKPTNDSTNDSLVRDETQINKREIIKNAKNNLNNASMRDSLKMNLQNQ